MIILVVHIVLKATVRHKDGEVRQAVVLSTFVDGEPVGWIISNHITTVMNTGIRMTCLNLVDEVGGFRSRGIVHRANLLIGHVKRSGFGRPGLALRQEEKAVGADAVNRH